MENYKKNFIEFLLESGALKFGEFETKSGRIAPYFINTGSFSTGEQISRFGSFYAKALVEQKLNFDVVYGPAYKGIPLALTTTISLWRDFQTNKSYSFNRKEEKKHGDKGLIVGADFKQPARVVIIDDVITAGTSIRETVELFDKFPKISLTGILIAVDRQERGGTRKSSIKELSEELQVPIFSIVTMTEILEYVKDKVKLDELTMFKIRDYRAKYAAE